MTIEFPCRCGHVFSVNEDEAGLSIQCPACGLLNDAPTHDDLLAIGEDGTYRLESGPEVPNPELAAELASVYRPGSLDADGNERNLKLTTADLHAIDGGTIPLAPDRPSHEDAPRYDPETGERIVPLEIKPSENEAVDPSTIPMARTALEYASPNTARRGSFVQAFVHLLAPMNVAVMLAVFGMHVLLFPIEFVSSMGIFILSFFLVAFVAGFFAHYGNVIEDIGPFEKDELPRPFRDLGWYEDLWHPFSSVTASLVICYLPGVVLCITLLERGNFDTAGIVNFFFGALGTFLFPAVLLSLHCSGTILNLRPDRVLRVIVECGAGYLFVLVIWVAAAASYFVGVVGTALVIGEMMDKLPSRSSLLIEWGILLSALAVGIFLMHYFCVCLGLLYRAHHDAFPWVFQRHVPTKKFGHDGPPVRPIRASSEPRPVRNAIVLNDQTQNFPAPPPEHANGNALLGRWVLVQSARNGHASGSTEFVLRADGTLDYISFVGGEARIIHMTYRLEPHHIVSRQLPASKEVRTSYARDPAGNLILELNGQRATFKRAQEMPHPPA